MKVIFHDDFCRVYTSDPAASAGRMASIVEVITLHMEFVKAQPARDTYLKKISKQLSLGRDDIIGISAGFDNHQDDWGGLLRTDDYHDIGNWVPNAALNIES